MSTNQNHQEHIKARKQTEEYKRLQQDRNCKEKDPNWKETPWKKWGPYLSDRQWATVREDYSIPKDKSTESKPWGYFTYDKALSRAYRWGEDGIFGISDDHQRLCFALTLWNCKDTHLKERFFGLTGLFSEDNEGNHMEDVKEYYFYLDNTPTHSYMKALYKYPYEFPYKDLIDENKKRKENESGGKNKPEYELIDTGCFDAGYFDVLIEYAKKDPEDILIKITVWNQGTQADKLPHKLHILPTLWFRNTWSWDENAKTEKEEGKLCFLKALPKPVENNTVIHAHHSELGDRYLYCQNEIPLLFTENETNLNSINNSTYVKDSINNCVMKEDFAQVNHSQRGTKASAHYILTLSPKQPKEIWLRLTNIAPYTQQDSGIFEPFGDDFENTFEKRRKESDEFYESITPFLPFSQDKKEAEKQMQMQQIQRQAFAGMLWNKQFYYYIVENWLNEDLVYLPEKPSEEEKNKRRSEKSRNSSWIHLHNEDIISMPDKWEYPYYCVWDSVFHAITFALIDPDFAKEQLKLFTQSPRYMKPNSGQIPSCEFNFDEIHPPNIAWAALKIHEIEEEMYGSASLKFLGEIFRNLEKNLKWWENKNKVTDKYLFQAGFLGLDNISVVDRNQFVGNETVSVEQVDATSWAAIFHLNMLKIATMLNIQGKEKIEEHKNKVKNFLETFIRIVHEINEIVDENQVSLWDKEDNFFYEVLRISLGKFSLELPLKYRSAIGLIPLLAVEIFSSTEASIMTEELRKSFHDKGSNQFKDFTSKPEFEYLLGEEEFIYIRKQEDENKILDMFLSIVNKQKLNNILNKMLDEDEFLSKYGIRSLSKIHEEHPYQLDGIIKIMWKPGDTQSFPIEMKYEPAETKVPVHTGNSNWRGPIWFPINFLLIESLKKFHKYFNICLDQKNFKVLCPSVSHQRISLQEVAIKLSERLINIFLIDSKGKRAVYGDNDKLYKLFKNPENNEQDLILFYEYFNGDTGQGLGASHQTGWTGLVANLIHQVIQYEHEKKAEKEKMTQKDQATP